MCETQKKDVTGEKDLRHLHMKITNKIIIFRSYCKCTGYNRPTDFSLPSRQMHV